MNREEINGFLIDDFNQHSLKEGDDDSIKVISGKYYIDVTITGWISQNELKSFLENPNRK